MPRLSTEVVEVLERAAAHPDGGEALLTGQVAAVAALYQLHPEKVEAVRAHVALPGKRLQADAILERPRVQTVPAAPAPRADAASLIASASRSPAALDFLARAPLDTAAVVLGVHPFVVEQARVQLATSRSS